MFKAIAIVAAFTIAVPVVPALAANSPPALVAACQSALEGQPRIVRKEAVRAIGKGAHIYVVPFCIGIQVDQFGNAAGLGKTIGANPVLAAVLKRHGWRADDVTGIVITGNSVRLYVHRD